MQKISPSLIQTWLFLINSNDPMLSYAKGDALRAVKKQFGSVDLARIYLEQHKDNQIEVVII